VAATKYKIICKKCHTSFFVAKGELKRNPKFCSQQCYWEYLRENTTLIIKKCICGKEFKSYKTENRKFCCLECSRKYQSHNKKELITKICYECGKEFLIKACYKNIFCSHKCCNKNGVNLKWNNILTKDFLNKEYIENKKSCEEIGNNIGCNKVIISEWLKRHAIKARTPMEAFLQYSPEKHGCRWHACYYNNKYFRSSWEANFAKWCDLSGIKWEYEPKVFDVFLCSKKHGYLPDFYLPEFDTWIEIKGYLSKDAKAKFEEFKKQHKRINIELFEKNRLCEISVLN
jgi:hypothetical protein